ncbi:MAG: hypothetical protein ACPGC9_02255, partial [Cytophagales bacterium]
ACMIACLATFTKMYTSMNGKDQVIQEGRSYATMIKTCVIFLIVSYLLSGIRDIRIGDRRIEDMMQVVEDMRIKTILFSYIIIPVTAGRKDHHINGCNLLLLLGVSVFYP